MLVTRGLCCNMHHMAEELMKEPLVMYNDNVQISCPIIMPRPPFQGQSEVHRLPLNVFWVLPLQGWGGKSILPHHLHRGVLGKVPQRWL